MEILGLEKTRWKKSFVFSVKLKKKYVNLIVEILAENKFLTSDIARSETWHSDDSSIVEKAGYHGFFEPNHKTKASGVELFVDQKIQVQVEDSKKEFQI